MVQEKGAALLATLGEMNCHARLDEFNELARRVEPMPPQHFGKEYAEHLIYIFMSVSNC